jgi:3',5'-cyclic AMP phosphodiesterase CpdA
MKDRIDRRQFLRISALSLGAGALYRVAPAWAGSGAAQDVAAEQGRRNGESVTPFTFVQMSDTHVGFAAAPNPTGTQAFERAVDMVNALPVRPELILFTGDLTHESEVPGEHEGRMRRFRSIAARIEGPVMHAVPGEHDAGLDGGALFRANFGETTYAFDRRGVHFVALDNVSRAKPEVGPERIAWLKRDLARFSPTTPIVVFTGPSSTSGRTGSGSPGTAIRSWPCWRPTRTSPSSTATSTERTSTRRRTPCTAPPGPSSSRSRTRRPRPRRSPCRSTRITRSGISGCGR